MPATNIPPQAIPKTPDVPVSSASHTSQPIIPLQTTRSVLTQIQASAKVQPSNVGTILKDEKIAALTRAYCGYLPHNPNRPPPVSYQRLHEFPPFPPLAQHPVLPFLTTAFSTTQPQQENKPPAVPSTKAKPLAPKASTTQRHVQSHISTIPTMDVNKNDPSAIFIRPPFVVPHPRISEGSAAESSENEPLPGTPLTYALMHNRRDWFLDPDDFRKDNPSRIDYPSELEPPRGWAPLSECVGSGAMSRAKQGKEKNSAIRTKGSYPSATSEETEFGASDECHEKTVLRCTFCRREYHGPNAKSMWRRHVFDKHKVAMKNRREGSAGTLSRSVSRKGKLKPAREPTPSPDVSLDTPSLTLDLTNEQNIVRLLERVVSGSINISLPSTLFSEGRLTNFTLEDVAEILQKSGVSVTLDKGSSSDGCSVTPPTTDSEASQDSQDSNSTPLNSQSQGATISVNRRVFSTDTSPVVERQRDSCIWQSLTKCKGGGAGPDAFTPTICARSPLRDNTAADRSYHNALIRPGTPEREEVIHKTSATPKTPNRSKVSTSISPASVQHNPFTPQRPFPNTAIRAHALATTGHESYLSLVVSSPALSSPLRGTGRLTFTSPSKSRGTPKSKFKDSSRSGEDLATLLQPYNFSIGESENTYMFDDIPLEMDTVSQSKWTPSTSLAPPASLRPSVKRTRSTLHVGGRRDRDDDSEFRLISKPMQGDNKQGHDRHDSDIESSPLDSIQRRCSSADSKMHADDFNLNEFLEMDDVASGVGSSAPTSPSKPILTRGFSKEFGLLSQEEVDRLTGSALSSFEEEARSSKRRKVGDLH